MDEVIIEINEHGQISPCPACGNPTPGIEHSCTDYLKEQLAAERLRGVGYKAAIDELHKRLDWILFLIKEVERKMKTWETPANFQGGLEKLFFVANEVRQAIDAAKAGKEK